LAQGLVSIQIGSQNSIATNMAFRIAIVVLALSGLASAEASRISPVQKTMGLLADMLAKGKTEVQSVSKDYRDFAQFCEQANKKKDFALSHSAEEITGLDAAIEDSNAAISGYEMQITDLSTKISASDAELQKATALRAKEHEDFLVLEKELSDAVTAIQAVTESGKVALTQLTPDAKRHLDVLKSGIERVVEAGFVTEAKGAKVSAFLQSREDAEDGLSARNPEGDTLGRVVELAERALGGARKKEAEAEMSFSSVKQNLDNEISNMNTQLKDATHAKQVSSESLAQAEKDLALEKKGHAEDSAAQTDLKHDCNSKAQNYEVEYRDASKAVKAMIEAEKILQAKFGASLLETTVARRVASKAVQSANSDGKTRALRLIEQLGRRLKSTALVSLSYRAAADPFAKVRGMVEDMLAKLQQEAAEEATHQAFCNEEMSKTEKSKSIKEMDIDKSDARLEKATAGVQSLTESIAALAGEVTDLDTSIAEVTGIRNTEKARFTTSETDLAESVDAVRSAIQALQAYFEKGPALIQEGAFVPPVLQMLEFTESDFETLLADARAAESTAVEQFEQITKDGKEDKTIKEAEINSKKSEVKSLNMAVRNYGEDKEGTSTELEAVLGYLAELKPKCEQEAPPSYAEQKARREQELDGLKEALKLLE